jgi:hypothetical protein
VKICFAYAHRYLPRVDKAQNAFTHSLPADRVTSDATRYPGNAVAIEGVGFSTAFDIKLIHKFFAIRTSLSCLILNIRMRSSAHSATGSEMPIDGAVAMEQIW